MADEERARPGLRVWPEDEADARLRALSAEMRGPDVQRAKDLARVAQSRHYRFCGCANLAEYGRTLGLRPCETWDRAKAGLLLQLRPDLEEDLLSGRIPFATAGALYDVASLADEDADGWIALARSESAPMFRRRVDDHLEGRRIGCPPVRVLLLLSRRARALLERARDILERRQGRTLLEGEVIEELVSDFVQRNEVVHVPGVEAPPDAGMVRDGRYVPVGVQEAVWTRDRGTCAVPGCNARRRLQLGHVVAYRHGGKQTVENLLLLCPVHNAMMEAGLLRIEGDANAPRFFDARGRPYRRGPADDRPRFPRHPPPWR